MASQQFYQCEVCNRYTDTVCRRRFTDHFTIYACFQCANIPRCHQHKKLMRGSVNNEFTTDEICAFCKELYAYNETGNVVRYLVTRLHDFYCYNPRCNRYLCDNCATELTSGYGNELTDADKKKPKGTSDVLDE